MLVGDGPLRRELEQTASELGIAAACRFTGYLDDVAECYAAFDAVALSSANEGTPVTVIEAQAAGLPVVSTDVGGVRDVVADGESGFLVPPGDVDAMADALAMLAGAPELRSSIRRAGSGRADPLLRAAPRRRSRRPLPRASRGRPRRRASVAVGARGAAAASARRADTAPPTQRSGNCASSSSRSTSHLRSAPRNRACSRSPSTSPRAATT